MDNKNIDLILIEPVDNRFGDWKLLPVLGLAYIAAYLKKNNIETLIIDPAFDDLTLSGILQRLKIFNARIFGITALTQEINYAHKLAAKIKSQFPESIIIIGGPHVSALPEETLREFSAFDFVVVNEGEYTMLELVTKLKNKDADFSDIKGIAYRENGKIKVNPKRDWIVSLDDLPFPAWDLYPNLKNYKKFPILASRGCPFGCEFCVRATGDKAKFRSLQNIMQEIEWLIDEFNATYLSFEDEILTFKDKRTNEFLDMLIEKKISKKIKWFAQTRADLADFELFKKMKEAGCETIGIGVESGNAEILKKIRKGIKLEDATRAIEFCKKLKIRSQAYFILGNVDENVKNINETINFAARLNPYRVEFEIMIPYPGTQIMELARQNRGGYDSLSYDWQSYNKSLGAMRFSNIGNKRMKLMQFKSYVIFFLKNLRFKDLLIFFWKRKISFLIQIKNFLFEK